MSVKTKLAPVTTTSARQRPQGGPTSKREALAKTKECRDQRRHKTDDGDAAEEEDEVVAAAVEEDAAATLGANVKAVVKQPTVNSMETLRTERNDGKESVRS